MSTFAERLREAMQDAGITQKQLAEEVGCKQQTIQYLLQNAKGSRYTGQMAAALGVNVLWLAAGEGPKRPEDIESGEGQNPVPGAPPQTFAFVPAYDVVAAAGSGNEIYSEEPNGWRAYSREWVRKMGLSVKDLVMIEVDGDSMWPTILDGDDILVDMSRRDIADGDIYVFRVGQEMRVKRLKRNLNGTITVTSDNTNDPAYRDEVIAPSDLEDLDILGRVVWRGGSIRRRH